MTNASAYTVEEIQNKMEEAQNSLVTYLRKSSRSISAKKDVDDYESQIESTLKIFEKTLKEYSNDNELQSLFERFKSFNSSRKEHDPSAQKEMLIKILSDIKSLAHWRKMETAYSSSLGFSDFRNLRGDSKKR